MWNIHSTIYFDEIIFHYSLYANQYISTTVLKITSNNNFHHISFNISLSQIIRVFYSIYLIFIILKFRLYLEYFTDLVSRNRYGDYLIEIKKLCCPTHQRCFLQSLPPPFSLISKYLFWVMQFGIILVASVFT